MANKKKNNRTKGFISILALILVSGLSVNLWLLSSRSNSQLRDQKRYLMHTTVRQLLVSAKDLLDSPLSLNASINAAENSATANLLSCLNNIGYDCPLGPKPFSLYMEQNTGAADLFIDGDDPDSGFDIMMARCTGFNDPDNANCVYRISLTWQPDCVAAPCNLPGIRIQAQGLVKPNLKASYGVNTTTIFFSKRLN